MGLMADNCDYPGQNELSAQLDDGGTSYLEDRFQSSNINRLLELSPRNLAQSPQLIYTPRHTWYPEDQIFHWIG
jgi:hypothetical protein